MRRVAVINLAQNQHWIFHRCLTLHRCLAPHASGAALINSSSTHSISVAMNQQSSSSSSVATVDFFGMDPTASGSSSTSVALSPSKPAAAAPSAADRETGLLCSQCALHQTPDAFPLRLTTLTRYRICKSHAWYWTPAAKLTWAPEGISTSSDVIQDVERWVRRGHRGKQGSWVVSEAAAWTPEGQRQLIAGLATAGHWFCKKE